jgi:hypothetical protein
MLADGKIKIKERCEALIDNGTKHTLKANDETGEVSTHSKYDIAMDVLRYLIQAPQLARLIQSYACVIEYDFKTLNKSEMRREEYKNVLAEYRKVKKTNSI